MSLELGDTKQAAACYKKAIDANTSEVKYHLTRYAICSAFLSWRRISNYNLTLSAFRCQLLEDMGDKKKALQGYRRLMLVLGPEQAEQYLETAKDVARLLHERGDIESAKIGYFVTTCEFKGKLH